jgi:hypothetical protein
MILTTFGLVMHLHVDSNCSVHVQPLKALERYINSTTRRLLYNTLVIFVPTPVLLPAGHIEWQALDTFTTYIAKPRLKTGQ